MAGIDDLLKEVPDFISNSLGMRAVFGALGNAIDNFRAHRADVYNQLFITTSTWALQFWENELALPFDPSLSTDQRRERVLGRFRARKNPTPQAVRAMANSFQNGDVETYMDWEKYTLYVRFVDVRGVPANVAELQDQITKMVDANLQVVFQFRYLTVGELAQWGGSVSALQNFHLTVRQLMTWVPVTVQNSLRYLQSRFRLRSIVFAGHDTGLRYRLIGVQSNFRNLALRFAVTSASAFRNFASRFAMIPSHQAIYWGAWVDYNGGGITPNSGSYGGGGVISGTDALSVFESHAGKQVSMVHINNGSWYSNGAYQNFNGVNLDRDIQHGRLVVSEWHNWDQAAPINDYKLRLAAVANGDHDAYLTQFATDCKNWGGPIIFRLPHETNASWGNAWPWSTGVTNAGAQVTYGNLAVTGATYSAGSITYTVASTANLGIVVGTTQITVTGSNPTGFNVTAATITAITGTTITVAAANPGSAYVSGASIAFTWTNTPSDFVNFFRHVVGIFRSVGCTNAQFYWCMNGRAPTDNPYSTYYPGNDSNGKPYADWIGWDSYPWFGNTMQSAWRAGQTTEDTYAEMSALDPNLPMMVGETAWPGRRGSTMSVTSITANGYQLSVVVPSSPGGNGWQATQGLVLTGCGAFNGSFAIQSVSGTGPYTLIVPSTATGTYSGGGTAAMQDRILRASLITSDLETNIPAMPRIKCVEFFWTAYSDDEWTLDYAGGSDQVNNVDMVAFRNGIGNAHYLAGNIVGTNLDSYAPIIPFDIKQFSDKYQKEVLSTSFLEGFWPLTDATGSGTAVDLSSKGRNATVNGSIGLGSAGSIPAEPSLTSTLFPGSAGNNVQIAEI